MSALVLSATEQRVYRALLQVADQLDLQVTHRQVQSMARVAARAAKEPRPKDGEPRGTTGGRKAARKPPERPSGRRTPLRESTETPEASCGAPGAVSAIRGAA